jgi:hypothetical protein
LAQPTPSGEARKTPLFLIDASGVIPYLAGLLNRMTNPAIAAATLFIRCVGNHPLTCEGGDTFSLCH